LAVVGGCVGARLLRSPRVDVVVVSDKSVWTLHWVGKEVLSESWAQSSRLLWRARALADGMDRRVHWIPEESLTHSHAGLRSSGQSKILAMVWVCQSLAMGM
jgi:hypothetical protein